MPQIIPIKDLRNTNEISEMAHRIHEPIFVTKNGYSDLVVMSSEYYENQMTSRSIENMIMRAEAEYARTGKKYSFDEAFDILSELYDE